MSDIKQIMPFFSVIIPAYNCENCVARCLDSLISQTFANWEAVVVNDGSKDRTHEVLMHYAKQDRRIRVFDQENAGVSAARNKALRQVRGEYIIFIDSDDWYEADYCESLYGIIEDNPAVDVVFSTQFYFNEEQLYIGGKNSVEYPKTIVDLLTKFTYSFAMTCIRSKLMTAEMQFNPNLHFYEDGELLTRILSLRPQIVYLEKPGFHYLQGSMTHSKFTPKMLSQIETIETIDKRLRGIDKELNGAIDTKITAMIASMATVAAFDNTHEAELDKKLTKFARKNIGKVLLSKSRRTYKVKGVLVAISPRLAYTVIKKIVEAVS